MRKKDKFFACLFIVCFFVSAVIMTGDYLSKGLEKEWDKYHPVMGLPNRGESQSSELSSAEASKDSSTDKPPGQQAEQPAEQPESNTEASAEDNQEQSTEQLLEKLPLEFTTAGYEYFDDALFIGDSRTVGIMEYGNLQNATFFADSGMSVYGLAFKKLAVPDLGKVSFEELLGSRKFGKIYLMLGLNELGYRMDTTKERYRETVELIRSLQEDAVVFLCANMHVTKEQSDQDELYNNDNVNRMNEMIAELADGERLFYLDVNERFDDEDGSLAKEYSSDAFHVFGKHYMEWVDWLCTKAIQVPEH